MDKVVDLWLQDLYHCRGFEFRYPFQVLRFLDTYSFTQHNTTQHNTTQHKTKQNKEKKTKNEKKKKQYKTILNKV